MNGLGGNDVQQNKSDRERQVLYGITHISNIRQKKTMNKIRVTDTKNKLVITSGETEGRNGKTEVGDKEIQTTTQEINKLKGYTEERGFSHYL